VRTLHQLKAEGTITADTGSLRRKRRHAEPDADSGSRRGA
jgi:hypothetical protein